MEYTVSDVRSSRLTTRGQYGTPLRPRMMRNTRVSVHRIKRKSKLRTARTPKGIEVILRETVRTSYPDPENIDRVLELQNRDLWVRRQHVGHVHEHRASFMRHRQRIRRPHWCTRPFVPKILGPVWRSALRQQG